MVGLELEGLAQRGLVTLLDEQVGLARGRGQPLHERGHLVLGQGADELVHHLATADGEDGRDGLDRKALGHPGILVDVDLRQLHRALGGGHGPLQHGAERLARPAPGGPQVDDDGDGHAAGEHGLLEGLVGDVHRHDATGWDGANRPGRGGRAVGIVTVGTSTD